MSQHPAYELFEELGRGANTVVYRSYDLTLGREVAVKELGETARRDPRHRERFLRDAQFLAQFEHDNVLRVYSVDTERGWIVMELMKGTLARVISAGPSDPDLVRSVLKQTLEALAFLHEKNKVHGTVRPTNLLINDAGRVKLSEFEQTAAGGELRAPTGSKKYLAPELIRPEFGDFGPPLDLYCLGFTALEMLKGPQFDSLFPGTGKGAIDADVAWLRWHSSPDEYPSIRKAVKGIPDDLAQVLERMLKKHVADRPQSAQEVLKELADRPLVTIPISDSREPEALAPGAADLSLNPAVVRTLASPQSASPRSAAASGGGPAHAPSDTAAPAGATTAKSRGTKSATTSKPSAPRFSKDWWNEQLGRPYVLYPLCVLMLLFFLWFSFGRKSGSTAAEAPVAVTFKIEPDATGVQIAEEEKPLEPTDGKYPLKPGHHTVTFRKDGFQPRTQEIDVSKEKNTFAVKLDPVVKYVDITVQVTPPDSQVSISGQPQPLTNGALTQKLKDDEPLVIEAKHDGFVPFSRSYSPEDMAKLDHKIAIELDREKPKLPSSLSAKLGAEIDPETNFPVRAFAATLGDNEPLELALVKPGNYSFGAPEKDRRQDELSQRSVRIDQPYFIAIHETTNAQYQRFFEAAGESRAGNKWQKASAKWAGPTKLDPVKNHLPVTSVSAEQAQAFCRWSGGRLPTEIEWECAVRGPQDNGYPLPWGKDVPNREHCRIFYGEKLELGLGGPVPVEELPKGASPLGLMHAIGNAAEWCQDSEQPGSFILRGCSITTANIHDVRVTWRHRENPQGAEDTGFRVLIPITDTSPAPNTTSTAASQTDTPSAGPLAPLNMALWLLSNKFGR